MVPADKLGRYPIDIFRPRRETISKIISKSELKQIILLSCRVCRPIENIDFSNLGAKLNVETELLKEGENNFTAGVKLALASTTEEHGEDPDYKPDVELECHYALTYSLRNKEKIPTEDLSLLCDINGCYNAWPFFREFVLSMTKKMEVPSLTIPFLVIKAKKETKRKKESSPQKPEK